MAKLVNATVKKRPFFDFSLAINKCGRAQGVTSSPRRVVPTKNKQLIAAASKRYYDKNKEDYSRRSKEQRKRNRKWLIEQKSKPCMDCGCKYPWYVMEFHHRDPKDKTATIWKLLSRNGAIRQAIEEVKKCDLLCANCHRVREHKKRLVKRKVKIV